ncbi:hypothetical protein MMC28_007830 [Mycoblastus sanguinarius]|nr:hypothetical protein [Mycoblastus sanguinarius]
MLLDLCLLVLSQCIVFAQAAPATPNPALALTPNLLNSSAYDALSIPKYASQLPTPLLSSSHITPTSLPPSLSNLTSFETPITEYRVPGTNTILRLGLEPTEPIPKLSLGRTILRTNQSLYAYIAHYDASDTPLRRVDDPYESEVRWTGCFFGVATMPPDYHHLTYGIVGNVLQGLWWVLYRGERFETAVFEVRDDQFGTIGIGKITPKRPDMGLWGLEGLVGLGDGGNGTLMAS